jgi:hypothetical protein
MPHFQLTSMVIHIPGEKDTLAIKAHVFLMLQK